MARDVQKIKPKTALMVLRKAMVVLVDNLIELQQE
jgi:hypothetical protein